MTRIFMKCWLTLSFSGRTLFMLMFLSARVLLVQMNVLTLMAFDLDCWRTLNLVHFATKATNFDFNYPMHCSFIVLQLDEFDPNEFANKMMMWQPCDPLFYFDTANALWPPSQHCSRIGWITVKMHWLQWAKSFCHKVMKIKISWPDCKLPLMGFTPFHCTCPEYFVWLTESLWLFQVPLGEDDSIYMSLGEIPFLSMWKVHFILFFSVQISRISCRGDLS